mmetsp:Transcript_1531/g.6067  ORF Transcript_1531/g.6067 Transcript_1531/m.6067 type:complete len:316 (+) Transcript_1531:1068-2015(+)
MMTPSAWIVVSGTPSTYASMALSAAQEPLSRASSLSTWRRMAGAPPPPSARNTSTLRRIRMVTGRVAGSRPWSRGASWSWEAVGDAEGDTLPSKGAAAPLRPPVLVPCRPGRPFVIEERPATGPSWGVRERPPADRSGAPARGCEGPLPAPLPPPPLPGAAPSRLPIVPASDGGPVRDAPPPPAPIPPSLVPEPASASPYPGSAPWLCASRAWPGRGRPTAGPSVTGGPADVGMASGGGRWSADGPSPSASAADPVGDAGAAGCRVTTAEVRKPSSSRSTPSNMALRTALSLGLSNTVMKPREPAPTEMTGGMGP